MCYRQQNAWNVAEQIHILEIIDVLTCSMSDIFLKHFGGRLNLYRKKRSNDSCFTFLVLVLIQKIFFMQNGLKHIKYPLICCNYSTQLNGHFKTIQFIG